MSRDYLLYLEDMQVSCKKLVLWDILQKEIRQILEQINQIIIEQTDDG
jgi:hypothetical protein